MKVVYDTCLYIDLLRASAHLDLFTSPHQIRYLSPIVLMELRSGARTLKKQKIVEKLTAPYSKAHRIIHMHPDQFLKAGEIISKLGATNKGFSHDVLIAVSTASIGATLFTNNKKDFARIKKRLPLKVEFV